MRGISYDGGGSGGGGGSKKRMEGNVVIDASPQHAQNTKIINIFFIIPHFISKSILVL